MQSVRVPSSSCSSSSHFCGRAGDFWPEMQRKLSLNVTTSFLAQQQIDCNKIEPKVTIRGGCFRDKINTQDTPGLMDMRLGFDERERNLFSSLNKLGINL